ncbi:MAG: hypothetical protein GPJ00_11390 [Microcystis aeruginosa W13-18]|nr:hypothetical protein [Microcystis aeruginosa W13-18]NCR36084.1 hypothetical protein [Microcystis aeruginosa S11-05]NCR49571.1 hypothetical protein [Microcystis aeruginosa S11-01]
MSTNLYGADVKVISQQGKYRQISSSFLGNLSMANPSASVPSFLREAFVAYSSYNNPQKQEVHKKIFNGCKLRSKML